MNKLLEQGLSGEAPRAGFREEVLGDSVTAFVRARRRRVWRRVASLSAAAVLIAGVAFLLGRYSLRAPAAEGPAAMTPSAADGQGVTVPSELVAWLDAAQFFKQLGMQDRMDRAYERASELLPQDRSAGRGTAGPVFAARGRRNEGQMRSVEPVGVSDLCDAFTDMSGVMAQSFGD